ncbi:MAG: TetR/AcrR family transcriptional regulator [Solirubrobacterales bacterium]
MSNENSPKSTRRYRKRRRAELEEQTKLRITEAAVDLHGSVGPAKTTISAVADRAGVQRATVYRHFPDEEALFDACSSHWAAQHPLPDLDAWVAIEDPDQRLRTALAELFSWYAAGEYMLSKTTRDAALVPAMRRPVEQMQAWFEAAIAVLVKGRGERGARRRRVRAAIGHAVSFDAWRSLAQRQGLSQREAVSLMVGLVAAAAD